VFFIFLALFAVCAGLVFVISVFGVQGESFEEALEKQKKNQSKEKEKKKQPTEKKKKVKKGKDAKNNNIQDSVDENLLVDPSGHVVEPVFVEPVAAPAPLKKEEVKLKKESKKKDDKKPDPVQPVQEESAVVEVAPKVQRSAPRPAQEQLAVQETVAVQKQAAAVAATPVIETKPTVTAVETKPAAAKEGKSTERKKIEIIEVDIEPKVEETEEKKKKKAPKEKLKKSTKSQCDEIMDIIRKSPLSDTEAQGIVDILLLKQTGKEENADDWIEPGKENEAKKMARQIAELRVELEEETGKASNLEKKMVTLRREVNESKGVLAQHKREHDEIVNKKTQEITGLNSRLQQVMGQLNNSVTLQRQLETNQSHYQATINNLQTQLSQVSNSAAPDPKLLTELEQLKNTRNELTTSQHNLQQKLNQKCAELDTLTAANQQLQMELAAGKQQHEVQLQAVAADKEQLRTQLEHQQMNGSNQQQQNEEQLEAAVNCRLAEAKQQHEAQLAAAIAENETTVQQLREQLAKQQADGSKQLTDSQSQMETAKHQLESQLEAVTSAKQQVQKELTLLKEKLSEKEVENTRLAEDNERLSEQVASSVERPATEGEEATKLNGHQEVDQHKLEEVNSTEKMWDEKYSKLSSQLQDTEERYKQLDTELQSTRSEVTRLKGKNDESVKQLAEQERKCVEAFARLFPGLDNTKADLPHLEEQARTFIQDLEKSCQLVTQSEDLSEEIAKLEAQNSNYKTVLAQTEDMLTNLESSVKSAEGEWKKKLETVESGCKQYKESLDQLTVTNQQLQSQIDKLNSKIKDLEEVKSELQSEKSSKDILAKKCAELQQLVAAGQQHINNHTNSEAVPNGTSDEA